jgi:hypothetical protein
MADPKTIYNWRRLAITTSCLEGGFGSGCGSGSGKASIADHS